MAGKGNKSALRGCPDGCDGDGASFTAVYIPALTLNRLTAQGQRRRPSSRIIVARLGRSNLCSPYSDLPRLETLKVTEISHTISQMGNPLQQTQAVLTNRRVFHHDQNVIKECRDRWQQGLNFL
jgi:hypothetical protein